MVSDAVLCMAEKGTPLQKFLLLSVVAKHLKGIKIYEDGVKVMLDVQDVFVKLYGGTPEQATDRIRRISKDLKNGKDILSGKEFGGFSRHRITGKGGYGRVVAEFKDALDLILEQKCRISTILRNEVFFSLSTSPPFCFLSLSTSPPFCFLSLSLSLSLFLYLSVSASPPILFSGY